MRKFSTCPIEEGQEFFADQPSIARKIAVLSDLGLGYLKLGHPSTILSGGEAQRVKLAGELGKLKRGKHNLYILDEPTTGLHFADIDRLLQSLNRLVDNGHSVVVIEHNLDVIKTADHIIDLGPEGGHKGGELIACGTPEQVAACKTSHTGRFLPGNPSEISKIVCVSKVRWLLVASSSENHEPSRPLSHTSGKAISRSTPSLA